MKVVGIIPARYQSSRLPGKPLEMIGHTSLIMRVFNQCSKVNLFEKVIVATDDKRIFDHVISAGGQVVMTSEAHESGTERCHEALGKMNEDIDFVINIQGDEPFINPDHIKALISSLNVETEIATLCMPIIEKRELLDPGIPKLVRDVNGDAMYFSRSLIPHLRDHQIGLQKDSFPYVKHIGIYAYRRDVLATIVSLSPSNIEIAEKLEQLRWLYNGVRISTVEIPFEETISVDTYEDLKNAIRISEKNKF